MGPFNLSNLGDKRVIGVVVLVLFLWQSTKADRGHSTNRDTKPRRKHNLRGSGNVDAAFIEKIK